MSRGSDERRDAGRYRTIRPNLREAGMVLHVIVGAGSVGSATARLLEERGEMVRLVSRSGTGPERPGIARVAADAADPAALRRIAQGASAIYNCANPAYHRWAVDWPPLAASLLQTATEVGAVLVTVNNLYGYGPVDHPMTEHDPFAPVGIKGQVRAKMWADALAAHQAGRVRVTEARASDYIGPGLTTTSHMGSRVIPRLLAQRPIRVLGNPDAPHSWTYVPDVARTLVVLATDARAWGRAWHVPTSPPLSQRQVIASMAEIAGLPAPPVGSIPNWVLRLGGLFSPTIREIREVLYQFDRPFVLDSTLFSGTFGIEPTPLPEALAATLRWWQGRGKPG
jgi:nucleoside-diphosphate-sugar epimerase